MPKTREDILAAFHATCPDSKGRMAYRQMVSLMRTLLPTATDGEIDLLINASCTFEDGSISFEHFTDWMLDGQGKTDCAKKSDKQRGRCVADREYGDARFANAQDADLGCASGAAVSPNASMSPSGRRSRRSVDGIGGLVSADGIGAAHESTSPTPRPPESPCRRNNLALLVAEAATQLLPKRVILVRHGESQGNIDSTIYRTVPDNAVELTAAGTQQALDVGKRIKELIGDEMVHVFVSPFQRTLQTYRNILEAIQPNIEREEKDPRIREQEFGNLQRDDFVKYREEQKHVGRYFYRFPTGESGADVHARCKDWWDSALLNINLRPNIEHVDNVLVITHGLTMRFILMQLFNWSPNTFQTIWNAGNCDMYVLKKDLTLPGASPYVLDPTSGDMPQSTISLLVEFKDGQKKPFRLNNYLSIPMPRTKQPEICKKMLEAQHGVDPNEVVHLDFFAGQFSKYQ